MPGCQFGNGCVVNPTVTVPAKSQVPSHTVYIDVGVLAHYDQFREDPKKSQMREISSILAESIPQHLKT